MDLTIDYYISLYGEPDIIIGKDVQSKYNYTYILCAGVFLIKNSDIGKNFIDDCLLEIDKKPYCIKNGKLQGLWAGECYEQGIMNLFCKGKYKNYYYLDNDKTFILNQIWPYKDFKTPLPLILHLAGWPSEEREKKFIDYIY